jgi:hypothetical protein
VEPLRISHDAFGRLRLVDFLSTEHLEQLCGWEYLDRDWVGEASGFTEWLRLDSQRDVTRSIAIDLAALPETTVQNMLAALRLPLRAGLDRQEIVAVLGEPTEIQTFVHDRVTLVFDVCAVDPYEVSCTVHQEQGLTYLTVHTTPLPD